ncbi:MAG: dihydroorotate dehydrogenase-like protein [Tannerella sp.]|jgi:dihydroorotate dehydrogenase (fumarate)|nr:dihydroorotate dehydrogenase-like protein [Tannerella sp.]
MAIFETKYAGLTLRNPLIIGSSGLTDKAKNNKKLEDAGVGAIVLKSLFEEQINMQGDVFMQSSDFPEAADYIRGYVKANQLEKYLSLIRETKSLCTIPVIASINCYKASAWAEFAKQIEEAGADAIELNIFYLCTNPDKSPDEMFDLYISILEKVKKHVTIPVIIKTGKGFSNIPRLANQLHLHGAQGIVLFNRYYRPDIDVYKMRVISGEVLSSPSDLSDTIRWTALIAGLVPAISIASSCGVYQWNDVIKCLLAGAHTVQICSTVYKNGTEIIPKMLKGIEEWMNETKYVSVSEFRGKLSFSNAENPSMYERSQFMRYFSDKK